MPTESKPIELNAACPDFNLDGVDGKKHALASYAQSKILVVGFTCNHCPYVQAYEERLKNIVQEFSKKGVSFVCINSNDEKAYPDDSFANMKKRAADLNFNWDYLHDPSQEIARRFNAACTPEFYIYDSKRTLRYHGRLDDNYKEPAQVKHHYLKDAITALLSDQRLSHPQTSAIGCSIKWKG